MIPELLVPAGDMDSAKAAITAGADAIYLGGKSFSARSFAQNFTEEEIETIIAYAALRGVKIYIAVNTLYGNEEIPKVMEFVHGMDKKGAAAFILQDIGLAGLLQNNLPGIELHASTQMTVHSAGGVKFMAKAGFSRVILSRELSLAEISHINEEIENLSIKTEVFAHGALCVSYSGQCLLSSMVGQRSGNRGKCAQPCRLTYDLLKNGKSVKHGHLLSPKDMMTLEILDDVIKTGVSALKIEGRMKSPEYVYVVTKAYRERLDNIQAKVDRSTINDVTQIFNRGGNFSTGYYSTHSGVSMMSTENPKSTGVFCGTVIGYKQGKCTIRFSEKMLPGDGIEIWTSKGANVGMGINRPLNRNDVATLTIEGSIEVGSDVYKSYDKRLIDETKKARVLDTRKTAVTGKITAKLGEPLEIELSRPPAVTSGWVMVNLKRAPVEKAQNAPVGKDEILKQLSKTGNTPFTIDFTHADIDDGIFISKSVLNELRRDAVAELEEAIIRVTQRNGEENFSMPEDVLSQTQNALRTDITQKLTVQIRDIDSLGTVLEHDVSRVYVDFTEKNIESLNRIQSDTAEIFLALPPISRNEAETALKGWVVELENANFAGYLAATYGQLNILQELGTKKKIILDHNFNIFNNWSKQSFQNASGTTLSQELTAAQLRHMAAENSEIIIYGRQVLMVMQNCPAGLYDAGKEGKHCGGRFSENSKYALLDRKDIQFPVITDCENCIAYVLNSKTLDTAARFGEIKNAGIEYLCLVFRDETDEEIDGIIATYTGLLSGSEYIGKNIDCTYGHFFRGVD